MSKLIQQSRNTEVGVSVLPFASTFMFKAGTGTIGTKDFTHEISKN